MKSQFYNIERLELAFNFAKDSAKNFFIPDFIRHQDFIHKSKKLLEDISIRLKNKEYKPHQILTIDIPKTGLTTRPGSIIEFADLVVLFSIICSFVEELDSKLPDNVYSFRLNPKYKEPEQFLLEHRDIPLLPFDKRKEIKRFEEWYEAWPTFDKETRKIIELEKYKFLVISDITSYYENINHEVLRKILEVEYQQCYEINLLMEFLRTWTAPLPDGYKVNRGIPQGNDISSFLGNIFLLPLDRELLKLESAKKIKYIRYMDDIKIFAIERSEAKEALFKMNSVLRDLQLNIQGAKTDIYPKEEFYNLISDDEFNELNDIVNDILEKENSDKQLFDKMIPRYLIKLKDFASRLGKGKIHKDKIRYFKRLITGFTHISKSDLAHRCFNALEDNPVLTDKIVNYFKTFTGGPKIPNRVFELIFSQEIFDYQVARLIEIYWHKKVIPPGLQDLLIKFVLNREANWAIRMNSLIMLSFFSLKLDERQTIEYLLSGEPNFKIKKAIIICLLQAPRKVRDKIIDDTLSDTDYRVSIFSKFLKDILNNKVTQKYELVNLARLENRLFVEESYKLLLLRDSEHSEILLELQVLLKKRILQKSSIPILVRFRIADTYQYIKKKLKKERESKYSNN